MIRIISLSTLFTVCLLVTGCASKPVPVEGVVKLDGVAVEGATVTFVTSDGKMSAAGQTDASGHFTLSTSGQPGAFPGEYKVVVLRAPKVSGNETMTPDSQDYMKHMKKEAAEQGAGKGPPNPADMMKNKMMGKGTTGGATPKLKSELPEIYASASTTPLTAKVPVDNQPIQIDLKGK